MARKHIATGLADFTTIFFETGEKEKRTGVVGNITAKPPNIWATRCFLPVRSPLNRRSHWHFLRE
jgi:hypothetical protein